MLLIPETVSVWVLAEEDTTATRSAVLIGVAVQSAALRHGVFLHRHDIPLAHGAEAVAAWSPWPEETFA